MPLSETILITTGLLALGMLSAGLLRKLTIPYTVLLVVIGMGLGRLGEAWPLLHPLRDFRLTPDVVLFIFLPTLIFESGLNLNARQLVKDIAPVMSLAVLALLLSTALVGLGIWLGLAIPLTTALLFGALISATDPVAVIAVFKELGVPQRLLVLVEGESLLNDATAIVAFKILLGLALFGGLSANQAGFALIGFLEAFFGGALVGVGFGLLASWLMLRPWAGGAEVLSLSLATAYAGFIVAEHSLHLSGVMAVASAAVTLGVVGMPRLPAGSSQALGEVWEFLAHVCNTLLFIMIGLSVDVASLAGRLDAILWAILLVLLARAATIYSLVPAATRLFRLPHVGPAERHVMWWGGLKGGLAIAIVLSIPAELEDRQFLIDLTLGVVLFSLLINATTIRPLIRRLGIDRLSPAECADLDTGMRLARARAGRTLSEFTDWHLLSESSRRRVEDSLDRSLRAEICRSTGELRMQRAWLDCLRLELRTLERLFRAGIVPQYIFFDLKGELQRQRDRIEASQAPMALSRSHNPFLRLESVVLRTLRESDRAARLLSRYQNLRSSQHLFKDIAQLLMAQAALEHLPRLTELEPAERDVLRTFYHQRVASFQAAVDELRADHPEFFMTFEAQLALRAALTRARQSADEAHHEGTLGAKPYSKLRHQLEQVLDGIPALTSSVPEPKIGALIAGVPLLHVLSAEVLARIAARAAVVGYLRDDTIIGEGERGDALYVLVRGRAAVSRSSAQGGENIVTRLEAGDFFGEIALLEDRVRSATVRATHPCTLIRIARRDILELAETYPEIGERLEVERQRRRRRDHGYET